MGLLVSTLAATDLLHGAGEEAVMRLLGLGKSREWPRGHVFWRADAASNRLVFPVTGQAKSSSSNLDGRELIHRFVRPGDVAGLSSCLDGLAPATTLQVTRFGEFFTVSRGAFARLVGEFPAVHRAATTVVCASSRCEITARREATLSSVGRRSARYILDHACLRRSDGARVLVNATQAELAARLGTVREVMARVITRLLDEGAVEREGRDLFIADWKQLRAQAGYVVQTSRMTQNARMASVRRTHRAFLHALHPREHGAVATRPETCRQYLGKLSQCHRMGCPAALLAAERVRTSAAGCRG